MLESVYLVLLAVALYTAKLATIDYRNDGYVAVVCGMTATVLFATLAFASFGVDVVDGGQTTTVAVDPLIWLCLGGAGAMLGTTLLAAFGKLPDPTDND